MITKSVQFSSQMSFDEPSNRSYIQRRGTIHGQIGTEGSAIMPGIYSGHSIAVLTSGGDAQGMNSSLRAIVRMGIYLGCKVYFIHEGYQGMVDGENNIRMASWSDVSNIIQLGGTVIGSARCQDFRERAGRLKAAKNLINLRISNLVIIGGDGSLTGANMFRHEWPELSKELFETKQVSEEDYNFCEHLNVVGLVGSIDNDFCGTDMTIGTDSALHRIIECTDAISTTASSHQRCFILEVMGRHCGYLALVASLACEADWVFIPEHPPESGWQEFICKRLSNNRKLGQRVNIIVLAEGAIDAECKPISADYVKNLIVEKLGFDTRITVLGHVQRGGAPSSFDRILSIRMGAEAVCALMSAKDNPDLPACVISIDGNCMKRVPLVECVEKTREIAKAMGEKNFSTAQTLRGKSFNNNLQVYLTLSKLHGPPEISADHKFQNIAIVNVGSPACGINAAMRSFVRISINYGHNVMAIYEGFKGLTEDKVFKLDWNDVRGWAGIGGSKIGIRRTLPSELGLDKIAENFRKFNFQALVLLGGFESFRSCIELFQARAQYPEFNIPLVVIPATISNNVPGTNFSLGADTAVNEITQIIDKIKQSALGTTRRVFVVETMGGKCGYLATMAGLAGGADAAYIYEEPVKLDDLLEDVKHLRAKIEDHVTRGLVLRSDGANKNYSTDFIYHLYSEESKGVFDCRMNVLGHVQQGGVPSPFDRNFGTKLGVKVASKINEELKALSTNAKPGAYVLGMLGKESKYSDLEVLIKETDLVNRIPHNQWWMRLRSLMRIMARHYTIYEQEAE